MAKLYNLARVYSNTIGFGSVTLGAAVAGYNTFSNAGVIDGDVVSYGIMDFNPGTGLPTRTEVGRGTYHAAGPTLDRTTILDSTNGGAAINLSGNEQVYITAISEDFDHTSGSILNVGTNTHAQIDAHIASVANPHNVTVAQIGAQPVDATLTTLSALADGAGWLYNNGAGVLAWSTPPVGVHNILDSTYHGDVLTGAITRGDLLIGNATPKISRYALAGISGSVLTRDANDPIWSTFALSGTAAKTYTFPATDQTIAGLAVVGQTFTTAQTINVNSTTALLVEQDGVNDNTLVVDTTNGGVIFGGTAASTPSIQLEVQKNDGSAFFAASVNSATATDHSLFYFLRGRGTHSSPTAVLNGDTIGSMRFAGQYGNTIGLFTTSSFISATAAGNFSGSSSPSYMSFFTTPVGSLTPVENIRIGSNGFISTFSGSASVRLHVRNTSATTNAVVETLRIENIVTGAGVGAAGLGTAADFYLETATNGTNQQAGRIAAIWTEATNATRKAKLQLSAYDTAQRIGLEIEATGTVVKHTFFGGIIYPYVAKAADYTLTVGDYLVNVTSNNVTLTLPTAASVAGQVYNLKNSGTGVVTIATTSAQTIDGNASGALTLNQYENLTVMSDGTNWMII